MNLDDLTIGQARELARLFQTAPSCADHPYKIGKAYFIRTVTHHHTGRLVAVYERELVLEDAAWIAWDGRFADTLAQGTLDEVEPFPAGHVIIGRGSIIDMVEWPHPLPREQR